VILRDSSGASTTKSTLINCTNTTTTTSTTSTTTNAPICTYAGGSATITYTSTTTTSTSTTAAPTTTSTSTSTTSTTSTSTTSTSTSTTLPPPTEQINLYAYGDICGASKDWTAGTVQEVKCDWLEVFDGTPSYGGITSLYYTTAGINVGTQLYSTVAGNPPVNDYDFVGNLILDMGYPPTTAKVITIANGIITAINNVSDLPACGTYNCP
jgi:hypothetical protein